MISSCNPVVQVLLQEEIIAFHLSFIVTAKQLHRLMERFALT